MIKRLTNEYMPYKISTALLCGNCRMSIVGYISNVTKRVEHMYKYCPSCGRKIYWKAADKQL